MHCIQNTKTLWLIRCFFRTRSPSFSSKTPTHWLFPEFYLPCSHSLFRSLQETFRKGRKKVRWDQDAPDETSYFHSLSLSAFCLRRSSKWERERIFLSFSTRIEIERGRERWKQRYIYILLVKPRFPLSRLKESKDMTEHKLSDIMQCLLCLHWILVASSKS